MAPQRSRGLGVSDSLLDALVAAMDRREAVALVTITSASGTAAHTLGNRLLVWQDAARVHVGALAVEPALRARIVAAARQALDAGAHETVELQLPGGALSCFIEVQRPPAHLIICGAGHIAVPLAAMAQLCDFEVSVLDDRAQYASRERFPGADRVIAGDFRTELDRLRRGLPHFDRRACVVLVTRGHQHDVDCLVELLDDPLPYIGMIGSRRRIRAVHELLRSEYALPPERFRNLYAPIGLDIGAHTPAEIAVAIVAELISVLRHGNGRSLREATAQSNRREE